MFGLNFYIELNLLKVKVRIVGSNSIKCYIDYDILMDSIFEIYFYFEVKEKKRISCYEFFYVFGVGYEY